MKNYFTLKLLVCLLTIICFNSESYSQLNGNYTIGTGGDYITIASAVNDLVSNGVTGPVFFNILTGVYNEKITIDSIPGSSSVNTVTFQSQTGNQSDVLWRGDYDFDDVMYVVTLDKADYVIFKNIDFYSYDISIFHLVRNCDGINILNNKIVTSFDVVFFPTTTIHSDSGSTVNLKIKDNEIKSQVGITLSGGNNRSYGIEIKNNEITACQALNLFNLDSLQIEKNIISTANFTFPIYIGVRSISLVYCSGYLWISKNNISSFGDARFYPGSGISIQNSNFQNATIVNNFILYGGGRGLQITNSENINVYYNTIKTEALSFLGELPVTNFVLRNSNNCKVINNIFGGIITSYQNDSNTALMSDYNSFYFTPAIGYGYNMYFNGTGYTDLGQYQVASNNDFNSTDAEVYFASPINLHLGVNSLGDTNLIGIPITGIIDDIDGDLRNPYYPYMGADEGDIPLPVELNSFRAAVSGNSVLLNWNTASEINNSGFYVERNNIGEEVSNNWQLLDFVKGNGTSNDPKNYSFSDKNLNTGKYKYRLKQTDFNGNYEYFYLSNEVTIGFPANFTLSQNFPNPFNPTTSINYEIPFDGKVSLKIFDMSGKEIATLVNEIKRAGYYSHNFNASGLSSGIYFYTLTSGSYSETKKMILIK